MKNPLHFLTILSIGGCIVFFALTIYFFLIGEILKSFNCIIAFISSLFLCAIFYAVNDWIEKYKD